jgi:hypothetical protein
MLTKILMLLVVAGVLWYGWRIWQKKLSAPQAEQAAGRDSRTEKKAVDDLVKCPRCGTYIAAGTAHDCAGRDG